MKNTLQNLNRPYYYCTAVSLRDKKTRKNLFRHTKEIAKKSDKSFLWVLFDTLHC